MSQKEKENIVNIPHIIIRLMPNCQLLMGYDKALLTSFGSVLLVSSSLLWYRASASRSSFTFSVSNTMFYLLKFLWPLYLATRASASLASWYLPLLYKYFGDSGNTTTIIAVAPMMNAKLAHCNQSTLLLIF